MKIGAATVENIIQSPEKIKNVTAYDSVIPHLGVCVCVCVCIYTQNTSLKEYTHLCVHCRIIHNSQDMEANQVPMNRGVGKKVVVYMYNEKLLGHKKE